MSSVCAVCGLETKKKCSGCKSVAYCSVEHQRQHWLCGHNKECRRFSGQEKNSFSIEAAAVEEPDKNLKKGNRVLQETAAAENLPSVVATPSTINKDGEPATLLRPDMAKSYYDGALLALTRVEVFQLPTEYNGQTTNDQGDHSSHPNAHRAFQDFVQMRRAILTYTGASAGMKLAQGTLSTGQMMRNGTNAAHSLLSGSARNNAVPRDPNISEVYERMEQALPTDVPMAFFCGFADMTLEMLMFLRDLSGERSHSEPLIVSAFSTCSAAYIVAQDRIRARLEQHRQGAEEHPEVVQSLDQLQAMRDQQNQS